MIKNEEDKIMKVIVYIRVSTKDQVEGYSLDSQEKLCREYCDRQGWEVIALFKEKGESAKTADRTELLNMLNYCRDNKGKTDMVLVHKLDRIARNTADHHGIRAQLSRCGMVLRSVSEKIDESPQGKFMETIYSAVAQYDNDIRGERSKEGMKERVRQGMWAWKAPLGYLNTPNGLAIDESRAQFIRKAFEKFTEGTYTLQRMTDYLNRLGLRTEKGKMITPQQLIKIFNNKLYIGKLEVKGWDEIYEGVHEKLVSEKVFYAVKAIREGRSNQILIPKNFSNPDFPLKSVLHCNKCNKSLTASWSKGRNKKYPYYHCVCGATRISKPLLEEQFVSYLKQIQPNEHISKLFSTLMMEVWKRKQSEASNTIKKIDEELFKMKEMKSKLIQKNLQNVISDADFREESERVNILITVKETERSEARENETNMDYLLGMSEALLANVATTWLDAKYEHKIRFQALLFPKGVLVEKEILRTATLGLPFNLISSFAGDENTLVTPAGLTPRVLAT